MSVRNFWTILLKILGLWLVIGGLNMLTQFTTAFSYINTYETSVLTIVLMIGSLLLTLGFYGFVLWLFVFKTSWLIDKLRLEQGFVDDKIEIEVKSTTLLRIATIVIGAIVFIDSLPHFFSQTVTFFQQKSMLVENPATGWILFYLIKAVVGYLLMTNSKWVVEKIERYASLR